MTEKRELNAREDLDRARSGALHDYAHRRFGGFDLPASLAGMLAGLAMVVLLSAVIALVAGTAIEQPVAAIQEASLTAALVSLLVLVASFLVGGWTAGRMARYDGVRNGALAGLLAVVLMIIVGAGAWFAGQETAMVPAIDLEAVFGDQTLAATIGALLAIAAIILSSALGGMFGERYHEHIDEKMESLAHDRQRLLESHVTESLRDSNSTRASEAASKRSHRRPEGGV